MLNFDYAFHLTMAGEHRKAIWYYMRCLAIRPHSSGVWRCLGGALVHTDEVAEAIDALERSTELQPDHAPTWRELAAAYEKDGNDASAAAARTRADELEKQPQPAKGSPR